MPKYGSIQIAAVGKLKAKHWKAAQDDYAKRLQHYTSFKLTEVRDYYGGSMPATTAIEREGEALLKAASGSHLVLLSPEGKSYSSEKLASWLRQRIEQHGSLGFMIGGPVGFAPSVESAAKEAISLSAMTFTHEMARVLLMEQIYRGFTILNGEKYHK